MQHNPSDIWIVQSSTSIQTTSVYDAHNQDVNVFVYLEGATLQSLISLAEMLDDGQAVWANCLVPWKSGAIVDVESALEVGRWLKMSGRKCMMTVPLERSALCLFEHLQVDVLCIDPIVPVLGVHRLDREAVVWAEDSLSTVLCIDMEHVCEEDRQWLADRNWRSITGDVP